jgi:hypothetical protein
LVIKTTTRKEKEPGNNNGFLSLPKVEVRLGLG